MSRMERIVVMISALLLGCAWLAPAMAEDKDRGNAVVIVAGEGDTANAPDAAPPVIVRQQAGTEPDDGDDQEAAAASQSFPLEEHALVVADSAHPGGFTLRLLDTEQYAFCQDVKVEVNGAGGTLEALAAGVKVADAAAPVEIVVSGKSPLGTNFEHRYSLENGKLAGLAGKKPVLWDAPAVSDLPPQQGKSGVATARHKAGASPVPAKAGPATTAEQWVRRLASPACADRDAAEAALLAMGKEAREAVRGAQDDNDPEVRFRARRLWGNSLRWLTLKGVSSEDFARLCQPVGDREENRRAWERAIAANAAGGLLPFFSELLETPKKSDEGENGGDKDQLRAAADGAMLLLEQAGAAELAGTLSKAVADGTLTSKKVLSLLSAMAETAIGGRKTQNELCLLCLHLWRHEDARKLALSSLIDRSPAAMALYRTIVRRGGLRQKEMTRMQDDGLPSCCARHMLFGVYVAVALEAPELLAGKDLPRNRINLQDMDKLALALAGLGLRAEAEKLVADADSPGLFYVRSLLAAAGGDTEKAKSDRAAALAALDKAPEKKPDAAEDGNKNDRRHPEKPLAALVGLARMMDDHDDTAAGALWRRIIESKSATPAHLAEAWLRLGRAAERHGEPARAAECYGKLLEVAGRGGVRLSLPERPGAAGKGGAAEEWLKSRIAELGRQPRKPAK